MTKRNYFLQGMRDGMPVCLGYFAVSFAFGIQAVGIGLSVFESSLLSAMNVTSAGQFAGINTMVHPGQYIAMLVSQLTINVELTFHKDGTYDFTTDQESKDKIMDIVWEAMRSGFERYLRDMMDFPEDMSFDDIIAMTGISFEDLMVNAESTMLADELAHRIARSGKYYAEDGKLYLSADKNAEIDQSVYVLYTQEKDALTLTECIPSADAGQLAGIQYPIVFAKAGK